MVLTKVSNLEEGNVLSKSIYSSDGKILLREGVKLSRNTINKLKNYGITHVYIKNELLKKIKKKTLVKESIKKLAVSTVKKYMTIFDPPDTLDNNTKGQEELLNKEELINIIDEIINDICNCEDLFVNLRDIRRLNDELFFHSTNVAILSVIFGKILNYNAQELKSLGMGALLHDIGKLKIPSKILNKPGKLTDKEFEQVKKHSLYSYQTLKSCTKISEVSATIAYQHHEKCDGSGYPLGLTKDKIHPFSRIVTIADIFDALQNNRSYRSGLKNEEVIKHLISMTKDNKLDSTILKKILHYLVPFPIGSRVRLYNHKVNSLLEGAVIELNNDISKPLVQILKVNNRKVHKPLTVNLEEELTDYQIEEVI
ncbi:HD-GYP domain-containing protein [Natroniella sulfidigena]|uniref:HD-GYP domain-containing protein n=1 Tax=Natroniella sulfidigena TaxID=723921 RepID=UPI00200B3BB0|nr:HD-GYP domain-containing protein [Natroniella sulfidigena]MCK8817897.1 HD-GYP domain-containing protein [Natroniella sulfidigena]